MTFRALPPSGVPIRLSDLLAGLRAMFLGGGAVGNFNAEVCEVFRVRHALTVSSGRAGLSLLFRALQQMHPGRNEVLIPAFTSFSVPSAVVNAGLRVSLYDVDPATLSPVRSSVAGAITDKTLCIVVCHLFGYPADLDLVLAEARQKGVAVVDDAAQAMGAHYRGRHVGTCGAAGLFSLSRGKNITAVDGGIVVTDDDALAEALASLPLEPVGAREYLALLVKGLILSFLLHPRCYWLPRSVPALNIGASVFEPRFSLRRFTAFQAGIALRMLRRLDGINGARRRVAARLSSLCAGNGGVLQPEGVPGGEAVYLRFPVLAARVVEKPELGVVKSYPAPLHLVPELKPHLAAGGEFPGATTLAQRLLTLPTHCYMMEGDCRRAAAFLSEV